MTPALVPPAPTHRTTCRICATPLVPILTLGSLYLSDFPNSAGTKAHPPVPLDLQRCPDPTCGLVQLADTTPREWLYGQYWYRSGVNEAMVAELRDVVQGALQRVELHALDTVVDIGANDGTLLAQYPRLNHPRLLRVAYEPARNLYDAVRPHASVVFPEFFAVREPWKAATRATIVTSIAMFYDLDDPHTFVRDVRHILAEQGVWIVQQAYLPAMLAQTAFDNICHEHLEYYDLRTMERLLAAHDLEVFDVELRTINGGSFRTYIQRRGGARPISPKVARLRAEEQELHQDPDRLFAQFAVRVQGVIRQLQSLLTLYQDHGEPVDLYAASTKANTLLQAAGIDARVIRQAWERSPEKIGRYVGVSGIPIVGEAEGRANPPAALLVGAWQFRDSFVQREAEYLQAGGQLIFPLPEVEVVDTTREALL